ncbi:uncharacterized protein PAC_18630 [Phialocephala subalpina]|uniref:Fungal N-terminal domain-containing protein n=1 Tax=Phialocephala subalpina TaxID=576137 RepID=A0A1L7XUN8_9HELO|nr:uncharacterized protein PAC_18630 [Phialocephala subalpina]
MALEAIGVAASITALAGAAAAAFRVSESMYNIAGRVRAVRDEIETFAMDIGVFAGVIKTAQLSFERHLKALNLQSPVLEYLEQSKVLHQLDKYSRRVTRQIKKIKKPILSIESSISIFARLRWIFYKRDIDSLTPMMLKVGAYLNIILSAVSMEVARQRGDDDEMKELKRQIRIHLRTIKVLQERQERQPKVSEGLRGFIGSSSLVDDIQEVVVELGQNMVDRDAIPIDDSRRRRLRSESRSIAPTLNNHTAPGYTNDTISSHSLQLRHASSLIRRRGQPSLQESGIDQISVLPQISARGPRLEAGPGHSPSLQAESQESRPAEFDNQGETAIVSHTNTDSNTSTDSDTGIISNTNSTTREESDFVLVQPHSYLFSFNPDHAIQSISGYIILKRGEQVSQTALLDPTLPQNLISLAHAIHLGCTIEPHDETESISIDFGNGKTKRNSGHVILRWSQGGHRKPLRVRCLVYEHDIRNLFFGKPFVEKRNHYWSRAENKL